MHVYSFFFFKAHQSVHVLSKFSHEKQTSTCIYITVLMPDGDPYPCVLSNGIPWCHELRMHIIKDLGQFSTYQTEVMHVYA